ncbi:MAG TPA: type II toxin-antitoxin system prevent-host-death family antitoxin [Aliidongia sp.]|uniref:type II toxin-antitoxin system prevent-host-death family antitoxin n=1 Tax=Aliidongia sp. TaxID=1914230 RepID=UPI002DDD9316|nr:type II toxin-antitoxin system prevent-host-death family antitoxin [Aliidongia sp.]HEV2673997.1 type II toxin-antitoxin system prevent-host-death family antitoxin [Aliidongia sp.]
MPTTISSREFNHDVGSAKRAAETGPVIVTDRGTPAFVLLRYEDYRRLADQGAANILDLLDHPDSADIDFEPPRLGQETLVPPDLD